VPQTQQVTSEPPSACTNACTNETAHEDGQTGADSHDAETPEQPGSDAAPEPPSDTTAAGGELRGGALAEAITALRRMPLTDAERAEAVRRLLDR